MATSNEAKVDALVATVAAYDAVSLALGNYEWIETLFGQAMRASEEGSHARRLCEMGQFLVQPLCELLEHEQKQLRALMSAARKACGEGE